MKEVDKKKQAVEINGKICVIDGVICSRGYCSESGCDFPNCANITEEFESFQKAKEKYQDLEIV